MRKIFLLLLCVMFISSMLFVGIGCKEEIASEETTEETEEVEEAVVEEAVEEETTETEEQKTYKIGHLIYTESFSGSVTMHENLKRVAEEIGNVEIVAADIGGDWAKVPEKVDYLLLQDIDGLIDASWGAETGLVTVDKCREANIPIISYDVQFESEYSYLVGADNYEAGQTNGEAIAKFIEEEWSGEFDYIMGQYPVVAGETIKGRLTGAVDKLIELGIEVPEDKFFIFDTGSAVETVKQNVMDFLTGHPDSDKIILIVNTDGWIAGVLAGVETMGREDDVAFFSCDGDPLALELLAEKGEGYFFKGTVNFNLNLYSDIALPTMIKLIEDPEGAADIPRIQNPELTFVSLENVQDYLN